MLKYLTLFFHLLSLNLFSWEKTEFIWNFGIISQCQKGKPANPIKFFEKGMQFDLKAYSNIQKGDLVWVQTKCMPLFVGYVLPRIVQPFVLIVMDGDESFPSDTKIDIEKLLKDPRILHVFAQNCDYQGQSKKISHIPIGIDFHTVAYKQKMVNWGETGSPLEQESSLKNLLRTLKPTYERKKRAFVDFHHFDSIRCGQMRRFQQLGEDRTMIFNRLLKTGLIDHGNRMRRSELWKTKGEYAFSISPHGNGLDCHRTWEDLALGCIVIVKTSPLDKLYEGLPVVIVKDWSEIHQANLDKWLVQYGDAFTNPAFRQKLSLNYWLDRCTSVAK